MCSSPDLEEQKKHPKRWTGKGSPCPGGVEGPAGSACFCVELMGSMTFEHIVRNFVLPSAGRPGCMPSEVGLGTSHFGLGTSQARHISGTEQPAYTLES